MFEFIITTLRLLRSILSGWRRDPEFRSPSVLVVITLFGGTLFYSTDEKWSVLDSLYFSVTTLTTMGFGGISPKMVLGKIFTMIYIFAGLSIILGFVDAVSKETLGLSNRRRQRSGEVGQGDEDVSS